MNITKKQSNQAGFTIIELLIATMIFAVILIVITYGILQTSRTYYLGVTQSKTQDTARTILETLSQEIQLSGGTITGTDAPSGQAIINNGTSQGFCINNRLYSYILGHQVSDSPTGTQVYHGLMVSNGCSAQAQNINVSSGLLGSELLAPNMRLANLTIVNTDDQNGLYTIDIRLVYGDDDLLCSPSVTDDCTSKTASTSTDNPDVTCKGGVGAQFCAVSDLETTVQIRVI